MNWIMIMAQAAPTNPTTGSGYVGMAFIASLLMVTMPVLAGYITHRSIHQLLALIFCIASVALFGFGATLSWIGGAFLLPISAGLWLVGLLFGLTSSIDAMAVSRERRERRRAEKAAKRTPPKPKNEVEYYEQHQAAPFHVKR